MRLVAHTQPIVGRVALGCLQGRVVLTLSHGRLHLDLLDEAHGSARSHQDACKNGGMAGAVVTHDAHLASWADQVVFLRDGQVTGQSIPAAVPAPLLAPGQAQ